MQQQPNRRPRRTHQYDPDLETEIVEIARTLAGGAVRATRGQVDYEEALSAAFEAGARALDRYRPAKAATDRRTWLIVKGRWELIDILDRDGVIIRAHRSRTKAAGARITARETDLTPPDAPPLFDRIPARGAADAHDGHLRALVNRAPLARRDRLLLVLRYEHGWIWREIAAALELTETATFHAHQRALGRLRDWMAGRGADTLADARLLVPG